MFTLLKNTIDMYVTISRFGYLATRVAWFHIGAFGFFVTFGIQKQAKT
jgi:hypothetical protein